MALTQGQERCIRTLDRPLVVAAGAGSGKTFTLTQRIAHALETGAVDDIGRVCAITFTNKAAGELKARIKAELRARGMAEQALKVDDAWISTIHGMCARILRAHAVELDLDPGFQMADSTFANVLRDRAVEQVLVSAQAGMLDEEGDFAKAVEALFAEYPARSTSFRGTSVESMLHMLMGTAGSSPLGFEGLVMRPPSVNPAALVRTVLDAFDDLSAIASAQKPSKTREEWIAQVAEASANVLRGMEEGHAGDVLWALRALDGLPMPKRVGTADYRAQVAEVQKLYRSCVMELRLAAAYPHLQTLVVLARCAQDLYARAKRVEGVLDNDDLLVMAYQAVSGLPELAEHYADKFQLVMVDEFQDTDQMQVDMIKLLAGPGACRLCTVGDAQQSIYRFRGADVSVYRRHLVSVQASDPEDVICLPDNFRSHTDVLALVDRVFEKPEMFGGEFMSLTAGRDEDRVKQPLVEGVPRVQVQLTSNSYGGAKSEEVRKCAAARIAEVFADLRDRGHSAGDMALLLGGMTHADLYARALRERGLPCVIAGGSVFASTPEAALVLNLARIVANPYRTQALHKVLTSPLFELSAGDLLFLTTGLDQLDGSPKRSNLCAGLMASVRALHERGVQPAWSARLVFALRVMGDFLEGSGRSSTSRLVMRALIESGWLSRMQDQGPEGLAKAANAYKAVRLIESIEEGQSAGPARVASQFESLLGESKEAPGALSATDGDFVRIMTVHASKGLEFPIVAVAEFRETGGDSSRLLASELKGATYLSLDLYNTVAALTGHANLGDLPALYASMTEGLDDEDELACAARQADGALALRAALFEYELVGDEEEAKRLLYVALTRAKEALVVSMMGKKTKDNPLATPKSCLSAVVHALAGPQGGFEPGVSHFDYCGQDLALVEHVALEVADSEDEGETEPRPCLYSEGAFPVPAEEMRVSVHRVPYAPAHEGVFSYSSIADASHRGDVLKRLAERFFAGADEAAQQLSFTISLKPLSTDDDSTDFSLGWHEANIGAATVEEDEGSWAYVKLSCADSDKATDLGTAFHRLAQHAVVTRSGQKLEEPSQERIAALARACNLDDVQLGRLREALDRWFASDVAEDAQQRAQLRAEVPFFVPLSLPGQASPAFLEGEIDLLGLDEETGNALVVDYKTGGRDDEELDELAEKHVLQAACYAFAIMRQGIGGVDAVFVRVERDRADAPGQPQCVRYRFSSDDLPVLEEAIAEVYLAR